MILASGGSVVNGRVVRSGVVSTGDGVTIISGGDIDGDLTIDEDGIHFG